MGDKKERNGCNGRRKEKKFRKEYWLIFTQKLCDPCKSLEAGAKFFDARSCINF